MPKVPKQVLKRFLPLVWLSIAAVAAWVLVHRIEEIDFDQVLQQLSEVPTSIVIAALLCSAGVYTTVGLYEGIAVAARQRPHSAPAGVPHGRDRQPDRPCDRRRDGQRRRAALSHVRAGRPDDPRSRRDHPAGRDAVRLRRRLADRFLAAPAPQRCEPRVSIAGRRGRRLRRARARQGRRVARVRSVAQGSRSRSAVNRSACPRCATPSCRSRSASRRSR